MFLTNFVVSLNDYLLLKNDFYELFLYEIDRDRIIEVKQIETIFDFIIKHHFNEPLIYDFLWLSKIILYLVSNEKAIRIILQIFFELNKVIPDFKGEINTYLNENTRTFTDLYNQEIYHFEEKTKYFEEKANYFEEMYHFNEDKFRIKEKYFKSKINYFRAKITV